MKWAARRSIAQLLERQRAAQLEELLERVRTLQLARGEALALDFPSVPTFRRIH